MQVVPESIALGFSACSCNVVNRFQYLLAVSNLRLKLRYDDLPAEFDFTFTVRRYAVECLVHRRLTDEAVALAALLGEGMAQMNGGGGVGGGGSEGEDDDMDME